MLERSIEVKFNKILKLNNILIREVLEDDFKDIEKIVTLMQSYLKAKGSDTIGPLIQYSQPQIKDNGKMIIKTFFMVQSKNLIHHIDEPYTMKSQIRVKNCMYARYKGEELFIKYGSDKIMITAFEQKIKLKGDIYTILVNDLENGIIADIFMECIDND